MGCVLMLEPIVDGELDDFGVSSKSFKLIKDTW